MSVTQQLEPIMFCFFAEVIGYEAGAVTHRKNIIQSDITR